MNRTQMVSAATAFALALAVPAFAGGGSCQDHASATAASMHSCSEAHASAWSGAWLERSTSGQITVAGVAKGSPAARSGLREGDIVLAVNGHDLGNAEGREMCSKSDCNVGSSVTYKVQRGRATKALRFKLEKMPANATARFAEHQASFDPGLAAMVFPSAN